MHLWLVKNETLPTTTNQQAPPPYTKHPLRAISLTAIDQQHPSPSPSPILMVPNRQPASGSQSHRTVITTTSLTLPNTPLTPWIQHELPQYPNERKTQNARSPRITRAIEPRLPHFIFQPPTHIVPQKKTRKPHQQTSTHLDITIPNLSRLYILPGSSQPSMSI